MSTRILVVEDQPDNRQIIRDMLAPTDYEITEAENGEQALAVMAKQRPDLGCDSLGLLASDRSSFSIWPDAVYSVRDALSRLREVAPTLAETRKVQKFLSHPSPHA